MNKMIQDIIISNGGVVPFYAALHSKWSDATFTIQVGESEEWSWDEGNSEAKPTAGEVKTEIDRLQAEWDAQEYARKRKAEYDALNQFEMQYDDKEDGTTTWEDAIAAIKTKYPKG